jgi:hypothetical protein
MTDQLTLSVQVTPVGVLASTAATAPFGLTNIQAAIYAGLHISLFC